MYIVDGSLFVFYYLFIGFRKVFFFGYAFSFRFILRFFLDFGKVFSVGVSEVWFGGAFLVFLDVGAFKIFGFWGRCFGILDRRVRLILI